MTPTNQIPPFGVRMPKELKEWLQKASASNRRSLNSEIIVRLEESRTKELSQHGSKGNK